MLLSWMWACRMVEVVHLRQEAVDKAFASGTLVYGSTKNSWGWKMVQTPLLPAEVEFLPIGLSFF